MVKVSIGMPVYNGERYLTAAIDSILAQTFTQFELIICDNASDDHTQSICESFAARDPRIRYIRNATNIGAAANFNRCFELASGTYFKWAAHDDIIAPNFLERCVDVLDLAPDVVLCHSVVDLIDESGNHFAFYDPSILGTAKPRASDRVGGRLSTNWCKEVFGLIRAEKLRDSFLMAPHVGSDQALLADLALRGRFEILPDPLFKNRDHAERSTRAQPYVRLKWFTPTTSTSTRFYRWTLFCTMIRLVHRRVPDLSERLRCYRQIGYICIVRGRAVLLLLEPLFVLLPSAFEVFSKVVKAFGGAKNTHLAIRSRSSGMSASTQTKTPGHN